ncbi:unnamed protein product [Alopecurus aequalis]
MEVVGGMLTSAVLKLVVQEIAAVIKHRITLQRNFKNHLENMKEMLEMLEAVLKDAERRSIKEATVRLWLKRLTNAMYDISDMIDEFQEDTKPAGRKWPIVPSCCLAIGPKISMADKMKMVREKLDTIKNQHASFGFILGNISDAQPVCDPRETSSTMEEKIIPMPDEERKMMASLYGGMTQNFTILPIYGIGGIGKTTMARKVFYHPLFRDYSKVWVYVSQTFDLNKIGNSIISQLSTNATPCKDMQMIHNSLQEQFTAHTEILIVLDDLWQNEISRLQRLQGMLNLGEGRKVVVITTRDERIAGEIRTIEPHRVAPLTVDMCWDIMKQQSDFASRVGIKEYEDIGKAIAMKCGGVALAARSLGYMLKRIPFDRWGSVRDNYIWNLSASEDIPSKVLASLRLSYSVMPPLLKLCFAYCAIFPKGHKIFKDDIIYQWASLGFIEPPGSTWKQSGEDYIEQLLGLSFLEHCMAPLTSGQHHEDVTLFTMHDLVHDLASSIMMDEILVASKLSITGSSGWRYVLLDDCGKPLTASTDSPAKIRALRFMDCQKTSLDGAAFSSARSLRVLDLSQCYIHKLPDCIGRLKQLRYLNAPGLQDTLVPDSITGLTKLIYLSLRGSSTIVTLPNSVGKLKSLLYLDLSKCSSIEILPDSVGQLEGLLYLDLSKCPRFRKLPETVGKLQKLKYLNLGGSSNIQTLPESIGDMMSLLYLDLSGCEWIRQLPASFAKLTKLVHLDLSHCRVSIPEALGGFTKLQHLNLSVAFHLDLKPMRELTNVFGNLINLRYLNLSRCMHVMAPSKEEIDNLLGSISTLSNLEHLDISHNKEISSLPESMGNLQKLHILDILDCDKIKRLPESMGKMENLKVLDPKGPGSSGLNVASLPQFVVSRGEYRSDLIWLRHTNPEGALEISGLENVMATEEAQRVELVEKNTIDDLSFRWTVAAGRTVDDKEVLEKLVPPSSLRKWFISGYMGASIPGWMMDIGHYLPNLYRIDLSDFPKCNNLPPFGQLPNLLWLGLCRMQSMEKWNMTCSNGDNGANDLMFPKLETLSILDCPKLTIEPSPPRAVSWIISKSDNVLSAWAESASKAGASSSSSPLTNLKLEVQSCNLPLRQWRLLHHLPALCSLTIWSHIDLAASRDTIKQLSSLKSLTLWNSTIWNKKDGQAELPAWLFQLTSLQTLEVMNAKLDGLNEQLRKLKLLQSLRLQACTGMASQPQWLGKLTSLRKLDILQCKGIRSLPDSITELTKLEYLHVYDCPGLFQWWESDGNKMKLARIKTKTFKKPWSREE